MSLLNIHVARERALVACCTHVQAPKALVHTSKMLPLPHTHAVLAMRGEVMVFGWVHTALHLSCEPSFDTMLEAMPAVLHQVCQTRDRIAAAPNGQAFAGSEIALVGWSDAMDSMAGVRWERWPGDDHYKAIPVAPWSMSPDPGYDGLPPAPDTSERMTQVARDQVARFRREQPHEAIGGKLLIAEITSTSTAIRTVCELDAHDRQGQVPT